MHLWGQKHQTTITKATTQQPKLLNVCVPFVNHHICVVLSSSAHHHIDGWNCPKVMHKPKYNKILVN